MKLDLNFLKCKLNAIADNTCNISKSIEISTSNLISVQRIPTMTRSTGSSSIAAGTYSVSISNVGAANGTVLGATLEPGETVNFDAGAINNTLSAIAYDATGTEFLIIYLS